jgi:hypothetical protein
MDEGAREEVRPEARASQPGVSFAPGEVVRGDPPCLVCGYSLRSLAVAAQCPECGTPVERSLRGIYLGYSSPDYVRTMRRGITLVEASLLLQIALIACAVVVSSVAAFGGALTAAKTGKPPLAGMAASWQMAQQIAGSLVKLMTLLGWWMFSTPDPALMARDPGFKSRRLLRAFLSVSVVMSVAGLVASTFPGLKASLVPAGAAGAGRAGFVWTPGLIAALSVVGLVGVASLTMQLLGFIASMTYMMHLSRRLPDARLEKQAERYRWLLPVVCVGGIIMCMLGPLVAFIMYVVQIDGWRRRMGELVMTGQGEDRTETAGG